MEERRSDFGKIKRRFIPLKGNGIQSLIYDFYALRIAAAEADYILMLGVGAGVFLPLFSRSFKKKIILHVDGLEWRRTKWSLISKLFLRLSFILGIKSARFVIIDNSALLDYIPIRFQKKVRHITYGGDHLRQGMNASPPLSLPYALVIARAEPENNLTLILNSFDTYSGLHLIVVSNWNQTRFGRRLARQYANHPSISMIGPIYDITELQRYRQHCRVYVHGHSAGGTNPSLIEAMYSGKPVISWDNEFNRITTNNLAVYFKNRDELFEHLNNIDSSMIEQTGERLKKFAFSYYKWRDIADHFKDILLEI